MTQNIINIGNISDPQTQIAFTQTNNNFTQIWGTGLVNSNLQVNNTTILTLNTNGNLVLQPNGVGAVVAQSDILPDVGNVRSVGSGFNRFNTVYTQYLDTQSAAIYGNLYVQGNIAFTGSITNVAYTNLTVANNVITLAYGATSPVQAQDAGIFIDGANASLTYQATTDTLNSNLGLVAPYFIGDGANLTNVNANITATNLTGNTLSGSVLYSNLTSVGTLTSLSANGDISATGNITATGNIVGNIVMANVLMGDGGNIANISGNAITGNVPYAQYANIAGSANIAYLATQSVNADTALYALAAGSANTANVATQALIANVANYTCQAGTANAAGTAGMAYEVAPTANISVTGNIAAGGIKTDHYYYANGAPLNISTSFLITSNVVSQTPGLPLNFAVDYTNPSYPAGIWTLFEGNVPPPPGNGSMYYTTTATSANPNFTTSSPHYGNTWVPAPGAPGNTYGITTNSTFPTTQYYWLAIPDSSFWHYQTTGNLYYNYYLNGIGIVNSSFSAAYGNGTNVFGGSGGNVTIGGQPYVVLGFTDFANAQTGPSNPANVFLYVSTSSTS